MLPHAQLVEIKILLLHGCNGDEPVLFSVVHLPLRRSFLHHNYSSLS